MHFNYEYDAHKAEAKKMHTLITYLSPTCVNRVTLREQNLDIFEILLVSSAESTLTRGTRSFQRGIVGQRAANLQAVKVGGLKKKSATRPRPHSIHLACI